MKIGKFIETVGSTKDTIRHYENLNLLQPSWENKQRIYRERDMENFYAIKEMQALGMSLNEIQTVFEVKRQSGCASNDLITSIIEKLLEKREAFTEEEKVIKHKRLQVEEMVDSLNQLKKQSKQ